MIQQDRDLKSEEKIKGNRGDDRFKSNIYLMGFMGREKKCKRKKQSNNTTFHRIKEHHNLQI